MLTKEQSRTIRAKLGLSQRRAAADADVPRSYLNQFEMGRWIPTDAFLSKLSNFYEECGSLTAGQPVLDSSYLVPKAVCAATTNKSQLDAPTRPPDTLGSEDDTDSGDGWRTLGRTILAVGLVGGILAVTGNLPAAMYLARRATRGQ